MLPLARDEKTLLDCYGVARLCAFKSGNEGIQGFRCREEAPTNVWIEAKQVLQKNQLRIDTQVRFLKCLPNFPLHFL